MSTITYEDKKKYRKLDKTLSSINQQFIALSKLEQQRNNEILSKFLEMITSRMKNNSLFKEMYTRPFFGGSYFDGLRVGEPNEFDIDLLMSLPKALLPVGSLSNIPSYVHVQVDLDALKKHKNLAQRYNGIEKLVGENKYLDNDKIRHWMKGVVIKALNNFPKENAEYLIEIPFGAYYARKVMDKTLGKQNTNRMRTFTRNYAKFPKKKNGEIFLANIHENGPAFTLKIREKGSTKIIDVDLVPCFEFTEWPINGFTSNPVNEKPNYFIVPKPLKSNIPFKERYWRLSFQEQERELINRKQYLKPSVKLLKKLRDTQGHSCVASYYIKTLALWENEKMVADDWRSSLGSVFMKLLKDYHEAMENKNIPNYWYKKNNLIEHVSEQTAFDIKNRLKIIINKIDSNLENPNILADYLLSASERARWNP